MPSSDPNYAKEYMRGRYQRRKREAIETLGGRCVRCGSKDNLEVDHIDRSKKEFPFSRMYALSQERFDAELAKCQLLCNSCHVQKTIEERGHNKRTEHGTYVCYRYAGCRCDLCRQACRDQARRYREEKKKDGFVRKGDKWVASSSGSSS
jgi:hypothetical protein